MITGWIKLQQYNDCTNVALPGDLAPVYVSVDNIQSVYEAMDPNSDNDMTYTVINMVRGHVIVADPIAEVMQKIKLARPVRS